MEHQRAAISSANGLEPVVCGATIGDALPLLSRFALLQELPSSNKVRCFLAREHKETEQRIVQLSVFSSGDGNKESELLAFLLEAQAAAQLSHRHIASSTKPEQLGDMHFCVSEHPPDSVTLRSLLDRKGWLDVEESLMIAMQLVEALQYAHQCGIWHLKLQPEYVWINQDNQVTLTGFGIPSNPSRQWAYQRRSQECSLSYRSPEQIGEGHPDERSDLYGLGVLLYEVLTDLLPFNAQDEKQLRQKIAVKKAPPMHLLRPDIPEALSAIVAKLLLENPAERFQNAALLQSALNQSLEAKWQTINLQTEDFPIMGELEKAESRVENEPDCLPLEFEEAGESLASVFDDMDAEINPDPEPQLVINTLNCGALSKLSREAQPSVERQSPIGVAIVPSLSSAQEKPENIRLSVVERLRRGDFLPFTLMTLGVVLLTAVSVLAVKGDFKNLFNPSSGVSQTELQTTSPVMEKSGLPSSNPQAQSATEGSSAQTSRQPQSQQKSPSNVSSEAADTIPDEGSNASAAAQPLIMNQPSTSRSLAPEVSRLRQQLRRINEAKARNYKIRKNSSIAKPRPSKSHRRFFKWRPW